MNNIEGVVRELNEEIEKMERYLKYAKEGGVRDSLIWEIDRLKARREIWLSFLS